MTPAPTTYGFSGRIVDSVRTPVRRSVTSVTHQHRPAGEPQIRPYTGCVNHDDCLPETHGGVAEVDTCVCGATRRSNCNAGRVEYGSWT